MKLIDAKKDQYRKLAHEQGFRSRSSYKLKELNKSYRIIGPGSYVLDLGCSPGGWLQVAQKISGNQGKVIGIDISFVEEIPNLKIIQDNSKPLKFCPKKLLVLFKNVLLLDSDNFFCSSDSSLCL